MANDVMFEGKERRMPKIEKCLAEYGIGSLEEARDLCLSKGFNPYDIVKGVQPIAFENAGWAYTLGLSLIHISKVSPLTRWPPTVTPRRLNRHYPRFRTVK